MRMNLECRKNVCILIRQGDAGVVFSVWVVGLAFLFVFGLVLGGGGIESEFHPAL